MGLGNLVGGGLVVGAGYWLIGGRPRFDAASESPVRTSTKLREVKDSGGRSLGINPVRTAARQEEDIRVDEALALIAVANERVDQIKFRFWFLHMIRHMRGFSVYSRHEVYDEARNELFTRITRWNNDPALLNEMLTLDFKGKLGRRQNLELCDSDQIANM